MSARLLALIFSLAAATASANGANFDPFSGPRPLAVFIEQDPWLMVIGSDTPRVAVYEDGLVVFAKKVGERAYAYHAVTLPNAELAGLAQTWAPLAAQPLPRKHYELSGATDQPTASFYVVDGAKSQALSVYGLSCRFTLPAPTNPKDDAAPPAIVYEIHKSFCAMDFAISREWIPRYVEVMLWDYSYAPAGSVAWPKEWPGLNSERAIKRGDAYSIFLDGSQLPKLNNFLATRKEKGAVELAGKKWVIAYRYTFPGEPTWRKALWSN